MNPGARHLPSTKTGISSKKPAVLVIGPGKDARGGISAVISLHAESRFWAKYDCRLLETWDDRSIAAKLWAGLSAALKAPFAFRGRDLVHIHISEQTSFFRKSFFFVLAKLAGKATILHVHAASSDRLFHRGYAGVVRVVLTSADRVIALSPAWAREFRRECPKACVEVIPNPVAVPDAVSEEMKAKTPSVLFAGKLEARKGFSELLRAMAIVVKRIPNATLLFAGHGEIAAARSLAKDLGIESSVVFAGWLRGEEKKIAFEKAHVFCLPSYDEGLPMAVLEAMAYGLPVVSTPVGGIPDLIEPGINGVLVRPGDVPDLAAALIELLSTAGLRRRLGQCARATVEKYYSIDVVSEQIGALYESIILKT